MYDATDAAPARKIDPTRRPATRPDGSPLDPDRVEIGPTALAFAEWAEAGLTPPDLQAMRRFRLDRIVGRLRARDLAGVLIWDPLSIRYATDTTNMQLWAAHNPFRACLVTADGHMILWDYGGKDFLSAFNPLIRERRGEASFFYFATGERTEEKAARFGAEIDAVLRERCGGNRRLAVDKIQIAGLRALDRLGIEVHDGEEVMERARAVKGPDEIRAMRCAVDACARSVAAMREAAVPGAAENEIWAVLHAENIRRGGEWIETRLLASGPRTNPWFQECGPRVVRPNEVVGFDTDLVGCYGVCVDISRTWWLGPEPPPAELRRLHDHGVEHIARNADLVRPGATFRELTHGGHQLAEEFMKGRYGVRFHGVGLCDEWPSIKHPIDWAEHGYDGALEEGMCLCVEVLVQTEGGPFSVKLEDQLAVTADGFENLTVGVPFEPALA